jgi:hypothetical protein
VRGHGVTAALDYLAQVSGQVSGNPARVQFA